MLCNSISAMAENQELARSVTSMPIYAQVVKPSISKEPEQNGSSYIAPTADQCYGLKSSCNSAENFINPEMVCVLQSWSFHK